MIDLHMVRNGWRDYSSADPANQKILVCNDFHGIFLMLSDKKRKLRLSFMDANALGQRIKTDRWW